MSTLSEAPFQVTSPWRWRLRGVLNLLVVAVGVAVCVEWFGLPHVAGEYQCTGQPVTLERAFVADYYGPKGRLRLGPGDYGPGMGFVKWVPMEPPPSQRALGLLQTLMDRAAQWMRDRKWAGDNEPMWDEPEALR
ncbi:MAG: hypothetical protein ACRCT8_00675 [Lacipirellulaceae bacterium]